MPVNKKVDVVTVGAGWTASVMAWKLANAGLKVLSLEQGPDRAANPDFAHNHDMIRYSARKAMMVDLGKETWTWRPKPSVSALPMRQYGAFQPGKGVGGAGIHWSGQLFRFTPYDFNLYSYYTEKYGKSFLPENMRIRDWPISYEELEPYYDDYEYAIGASGVAGNLNGQIMPGGNPFEASRSRPYPLPPLAVTYPSHMFAESAKQLGFNPFPQPAAITSQGYRSPLGSYRSGCIYCGFCTRYGCEVDAKSSPVNSYIPAALQTRNYSILPNCKVTRVNVGPDGMATGVTYVNMLDGQEYEQPADIVVLSAYTLTNVRLLLLSRSQQHPNGIGNGYGNVGKYACHQLWVAPVSGVFEDQHFNLYMGNTCTQYTLYDLYGHTFDHSQLGFVGGGGAYCALGEVEPTTSATAVPIDGDKKWGQPWKDALRSRWDGTVPVYIQGASLSYESQIYDLDPTYKDSLGQPLLRITFDWQPNEFKMYGYMQQQLKHVMEGMNPTTIKTPELKPYNMNTFYGTHNTSGAAMGSDPTTSVTNKYGQVWDTPNVFVTGAALFPQNPGANPTDTICAMALMTGDAIKSTYLKNPRRLMA